MARYQICYDLHLEPPSVYADLIDILETIGARRAQGSVWFLDSPYTSTDVYNWLRPHLRRGDELLVTEIMLANTCGTVNSRSLRALRGEPEPETMQQTLERLLGIAGR